MAKQTKATAGKKNSRRGGRPPKLTVARVKEALTKTAGLKSAAARLLNVSRSTLYDFLDKHPTLKTHAEDIDEELLDLGESKLIQNIKAGEQRAVEFFLRTKGKKRGYTYQVDHGGPDGGPIPVENRYPEPDFDSMTDEQLKAYIAWQEAIAPKQADGTV